MPDDVCPYMEVSLNLEFNVSRLRRSNAPQWRVSFKYLDLKKMREMTESLADSCPIV